MTNSDTLAMYKFLLANNCSVDDSKKAIIFIREYSIKNGKFFCRHDWRQFEILPSGHNIFISGAWARCEKCGQIIHTRMAKPDKRMIDYSKYIMYI
jgi:hypothetical protein